MIHREELAVGAAKLEVEQGHMARQAAGAVTVRFGDTVILAAAQGGQNPLSQAGFVPLTVDYRAKFYAAGKIPGGFFKRETPPAVRCLLCSSGFRL